MTQEDKELLLKDLGGRLPYGVKILDVPANVVGKVFLISTTDAVQYETADDSVKQTLYNIKPYLLPLSSMTEKMVEELNAEGFFKTDDTITNISHLESKNGILKEIYTYVDIEGASILIEFFLSHHIDYRGLIEKGLAIDATGLNIY